MKTLLKEHFAIVLAFLLPTVLIVIVAANIYIPSFLLSTDYNFLYVTCSTGTARYPYYCDNYLQELYVIVDNKLVIRQVSPTRDSDKDGVPDIDENYTAHIFLHDTKKNESREIVLVDAQSMTLDSLVTSPDGLIVKGERGRYTSLFPFFGSSSSYGYYLAKGDKKSKLHLAYDDDSYYYRSNFHFIGWVLPGR